MRKHLSLSALLSSLIATPLLAAPPARPQEVPDSPVVLPGAAADTLTAPVIAQVEEQLQALAVGQSLDAHGMQRVQRQLAAAMNDHLERVRAAQRALAHHPQLFPVQFSATPPVPAAPGTALPNLAPAPLEKAAFLGVATSPVTPILREQLKLTRGMGLVVDYIEKDSPADSAGLKVHDILQKLDDQWLINPQQLAVLVRARKPGDSVGFTLLHAGQPTTLSAKLIEKDLPPLENMQDPFSNPSFTPLVPMPALPQLNGSPAIPHASSMSIHSNPDGSQTRTLIDEQNTISLNTTRDGQSTLTVKDLASNTLYSGPEAGAADKLPTGILAKIDRLRKGSNTFSVHLGEGDLITPNPANASATASRADADHQIVMQADSNGCLLRIRDVHTGQMLFDGPYRGDEDLKKLAPPVADKVRALEQKAAVSGGLLHTGMPLPGPAPGEQP